MVQYDKRILNELLDSYEKSLLSRGENKVTVRISYLFTKKKMPEYFDESSLAYEDIHACVRELENRQFITVVWKDKKKNHILEKVVLREEYIKEIYSYLKRMPKSVMESAVLEILEELKTAYDTPVAASFLQYLIVRIQQGKSVKEYIDLTDEKKIRQLTGAVFYIESNTKSCYIRECSILHFSDSKVLEGLLGLVGKIFRRFGKIYEEMDSYAILAEHNIYHVPDYVYLKGDCTVYFGEKDQSGTALGTIQQGIGISGEDIGNVMVKGSSKTKKVITIENLTTFFRWYEENSIIIYLGGYHNTVRRKLLESIYRNLPTAEYFHFGDIDVGGFEIYEDLCRRTGINFRTYYMDREVLKKYEKYTRKLTANDQKRLDSMIDKMDENCKYLDVLNYMKENGIKLEQECIRQE